ncbi:MAG: hypothetical protein HZA22_07955 [Nitrospirae bacterium]|nr:hypothetical protein [Nitrospirota bacterium]
MSEAGAGKPRGRKVLKVAAMCLLALAALYGAWYGYIYNQALQPQTGPLNLIDQRVINFHGSNGVTPHNFSLRITAVRYLRVMVKGDHNSIRFYRQVARETNPAYAYNSYQDDLIGAINAVCEDFDRVGYSLLLQVIEKKQGYPKALACACENVSWYAFSNSKDIVAEFGEEKTIAALTKNVCHKDAKVRLSAAAALLSLNKGDVALPVLEKIVLDGSPQSVGAVYALFKYRVTGPDPEAGYCRTSTDELLDKRGMEILKMTLTCPTTNEAKAVAALELSSMGHAELAEPAALALLKVFLIRGDLDCGANKTNGRALDYVTRTLIRMKSKAAVPYLKQLVLNGKASYNASSILEYLKSVDQQAYLEAKEYDDTHH